MREPFKLLIIDDSDEILTVLTNFFTKKKFKVVSASNGLDALKHIEKKDARFDLIITDQVMPGLTGVEISQKILELRPSIPILLITGYSEKITAENAKSFGLSGFFSKPINEDLFLNKISNDILWIQKGDLL